MPVNRLHLKSYPLHRLKVGQAVLLGPFSAANMGSNKIVKLRQKDPKKYGSWKFEQTQMLMVNPVTCETVKMYLLKRIA